MSTILWQSADGYVVVVEVARAEVDGPSPGELTALFDAGAWIVVWQEALLPGWNITRSRRYAKPALGDLRVHAPILQGGFYILPNGGAARQQREAGNVDGAELGQALYDAWQRVAAAALPAKLAYLGVNPDDYPVAAAPAWMRPGIPRHRADRVTIREALAELYA